MEGWQRQEQAGAGILIKRCGGNPPSLLRQGACSNFLDSCWCIGSLGHFIAAFTGGFVACMVIRSMLVSAFGPIPTVGNLACSFSLTTESIRVDRMSPSEPP